MTDDCSLTTEIAYPHLKGKPHWRRTLEVYLALERAPANATYPQLLAWVEQATGKRCSRKLIGKWKEERHLKAVISQPPEPPSILPSENDSTTPLFTRRVPEWIEQVAAVGVTTATLVGLGWLLTPEGKYKPLAIAEPPSASQQLPVNSQQLNPIPNPKPKIPNGLPREIKIELSLTSPQDLKVKPGDKIEPGQILSDRSTERQRLLNQRQQLQLSLKKLYIPIPAINPPRPVAPLAPLPPISYREEQAHIALKQQELGEAESAIANQKKKLQQLQQLSVNSQQSTADDLSIQNPDNSLLTVIEHEQAILRNLQAARDRASRLLDIARSQWVKAKEQRAQAVYQRYLEETTRAIALQNQQLELERQRTIRAGQLQEREYSQAQIQAKIQEVENAIAQLGTVKAPYSGTVKKVRWKGQSDRTLTVELTLAVTS